MVKIYLSWLRLSLQKPYKKIKLQTLYHGIGIVTGDCAVACVTSYPKILNIVSYLQYILKYCLL